MLSFGRHFRGRSVLKFLASPPAFLAAMGTAIFAFGIGLTSPIWFILAGRPPLEAIQAGTPIVAITIVGMVATVILGLIAHRLRKPDTTSVEAAPTTPSLSRGKELFIQVVVMLMFIIPFITIILGLIYQSVLDADAG